MDRRGFLTSALALTAGCTRRAGNGGSSTGSPPGVGSTQTTTWPPNGTATNTATATPTLDGTRTLSVQALSQGSLGDIGLRASASLVERTVTATHPARIRLRVSAASEITLTRIECPPGDIHHATAASGDDELVLTTGDPSVYESNCWRIQREALQMGAPCRQQPVTIAPNSPFDRTFTIWDHPDNSTCFPPGSYHAGDAFKKDGTSYTWSFTLRVTD